MKRKIWVGTLPALPLQHRDSNDSTRRRLAIKQSRPECEDEGGKHTIPAWTDEIGDEVCPVCGMICNGNRKQMWPEDFNFESRGGFESSGFPALNDSAPRFGPDTPMDSADLYPGGESNEA